MQVKNMIITTDKDLFMELLEKELINNCISYVRIDNEFHFEDKIYRFYSPKDYQDVVAKNLAAEVINFMDITDLHGHDITENIFIEEKPNVEGFKTTQNPTLNKQYIKEQNRLSNRQLRNNQRNYRKR